MPMTNAARIWAMRREAERNLAAKAEQEKNRTAQQRLAVSAPERDHPDPAPARLPEAAAQAPQEPRADRVRNAADRPAPRPVGHQPGSEPDRGGHDHDPVVGATGSGERISRDTQAAPVTARRAAAAPQESGGRDADPLGNRARREATRTLVRSVMHMRRCVDCGVSYPWYAMTLDDRSGRKADVLNDLVHRKVRQDTILGLVQQCDALCLNCRAKREYERLGPWPPLLKSRRVAST